MTAELKGAVEGLLFVSGDEGITQKQISRILEISEETTVHLLHELIFDYENIQRGMMIMKSNDIYHLTTKPQHNIYYKKLMEEPRSSRLSQAMLETLAIICYKQPVTKVDIEEVRGVNSDYAIQSLVQRALIEQKGRKESVGRPILYGTTKGFLTYFGLTSLQDLPVLPEETADILSEKEMDLFFDSSFLEEDS